MQGIQKLEPLEEKAVDMLVQAAGIQYGAINVEIQVKDGKRKRTEVMVRKTTVDG